MKAILATWNISECVHANWDVNKGVNLNLSTTEILQNCNTIIDLINKYNIDIICFQEFPIKLNNGCIVAQNIIDRTTLKYYYGIDTYPTFLAKNGRAGIAIFSKYEIVSKRFSFMKNPMFSKIGRDGKEYYSFDKGLITADLLVGEDTLTIVTGHGFSFSPFDAVAENYPDSFREIAKCAMNALDVQKNVVVLGDFNSENLFDILPALTSHFKDNLDGPTTTSGAMEGTFYGKGRKLDYFLSSLNVHVDETIMVKNFSDHYLCIGECTIL